MIALSLPFNPDFSYARELNPSYLKFDSSVESKTIPDSFPFEPGKAHLLSSFSSSVEVLEGTMKILKRLLWCALGAFVHPRELCPLQTVQKFVLLHEVSETVIALVAFEELDALVKTPVVGKTCHSSMSMKTRPLSIVRVELVSVCLMNQHQKMVFLGDYKLIQNSFSNDDLEGSLALSRFLVAVSNPNNTISTDNHVQEHSVPFSRAH